MDTAGEIVKELIKIGTLRAMDGEAGRTQVLVDREVEVTEAIPIEMTLQDRLLVDSAIK